jgi:hypothetical protein
MAKIKFAQLGGALLSSIAGIWVDHWLTQVKIGATALASISPGRSFFKVDTIVALKVDIVAKLGLRTVDMIEFDKVLGLVLRILDETLARYLYYELNRLCTARGCVLLQPRRFSY